ncbi:hypothetical protein [Amphibiibacter pelophylacis]|uniref:Uncharacterized protein n=1 Tax=Amphibiibacter pelophylacis TaxID=1799477 RepID=A0ACC6NYL7_9BURK
MSIPDTLKTRLDKNRAMISITVRVPVDVIDSMKAIAPQRGMAGYQTLLKSYLSEGLRRDEALFAVSDTQMRLLAALRRRGVPQELLDEVVQEASGEGA